MVSVLIPVLILGIFVSFNPSQVRGENQPAHHLSKQLVSLLQQQIGMELTASNNYLAMASYFGSEEVNRPGFAKFFKESAEEEFRHAQKLIDYLNKRGGSFIPSSFSGEPPIQTKWRDGVHVLSEALELEGKVTENLNNIHSNGSEDGHLTNFLESEFLEEQINSMRQLTGYFNNLNAMTNAGDSARNKLAEYLFDKQLQRDEL